MADVIIVGAGTAGLTAAIYVQRAGKQALVLEGNAYGGQITVTVSEDNIKMVLKDRGPGIPDVEKAMTAGFSTASENVRNLGFGAGMGLPNMKKYTDSIHIDTTIGVGTTVTMHIHLK